MSQVINIPKKTIAKAVMGDTEYKVSNKNRRFDEPRKKARYYNTAGRLTRAQILVLLEMHRHLNVNGYAFDIKVRQLSEATQLTMQCVNKALRVLSEKGFIVIGIKEYGYLNYFINRDDSFSKDENSGGYYQMDSTLLEHVLKIKSIHELRLILISLLEDDFSRVRNQKTIISYDSLKRIIPASAHPKARNRIIRKSKSSLYEFRHKDRNLIFTLKDEYYGKLVSQRIRLEMQHMLENFKRVHFSDMAKSNILTLCLEFGTPRIKEVLYCLSDDQLKDTDMIGIHIRNYIKAA